jgi:alpha-beta hydrolase superfamily lysophospholipase
MISSIEFKSSRHICRGRLYEPKPKAANGAGVVLAHGLGGTMDCGLFDYAQAFAEAGFHALVFDYRGFGESDGAPRQFISVPRQLEDWRHAIHFLRSHGNVDADRIGLWGISFSGGHVMHLAHGDAKIRGVVAQVPMIDPVLSAHVGNYQRGGAATQALMKAIVHRFKTRWFRSQAKMLQIAPGKASQPAVIGSAEAKAYIKLAGKTWKNELHPDSFLKGAFESNNASLLTDEMTTPMLLQIGDIDKVVSNEATHNFARRCGPLARLTSYRGDHFTLLQDNSERRAAIAEAIGFYEAKLIL